MVSEDFDDMALAVFKFEVERRIYNYDKVLFLEIDGEDPSERIINEFEDNPHLVKVASESEWVDQEGYGFGRVVDKETGTPGKIFHVSENITWMSDISITVPGGSHTSCLGADWGTYSLEWQDGEWVVQEYVIEVFTQVPANKSNHAGLVKLSAFLFQKSRHLYQAGV